MEAAREKGVKILPVDSEHNAIFQVFDFEQADQVDRITLTASHTAADIDTLASELDS